MRHKPGLRGHAFKISTFKKLVIRATINKKNGVGCKKNQAILYLLFPYFVYRNVKPFFFSYLAYPPPTYETTVETENGDDHYKRFK